MLFSLPQGWTFLFHCSFSRRRQELMQNKPSTNTSHLHHQTITNHKHRPYRDACMRWFVLWGHRDMKCDVFCSVCWFHMAECDTGAAAQWEPLKFRLQNHAGGLTYHLISHRWHQMVITFVWVRGQLEVVWCAAQSLFQISAEEKDLAVMQVLVLLVSDSDGYFISHQDRTCLFVRVFSSAYTQLSLH